MSDHPEQEDGPRQSPPVFLERQGYRRRRLMDAARLIPILGGTLFAVPLLWPAGPGEGGDAPVPMSSAILYIFGVWAALILVAVLFGRASLRWSGPDGSGGEGAGGGRG